jgi:hypothetical protein
MYKSNTGRLLRAVSAYGNSLVPENNPQAPWYHDMLVRAVEKLMNWM